MVAATAPSIKTGSPDAYGRGHRLRLHVTSSSFPRLERNPNTGAPNNSDEVRAVIATNRVHHGRMRRSWLELYVLPNAN